MPVLFLSSWSWSFGPASPRREKAATNYATVDFNPAFGNALGNVNVADAHHAAPDGSSVRTQGRWYRILIVMPTRVKGFPIGQCLLTFIPRSCVPVDFLQFMNIACSPYRCHPGTAALPPRKLPRCGRHPAMHARRQVRALRQGDPALCIRPARRIPDNRR